jgi:acyl-CoA thioester hydrolase
MNINFSNVTKVRVRYGETDQMGYCYYGNYAQYFEVGRVEALRSIGMSYKNMEKAGIMLPVSEFSVKYKLPALYDDELTIVTKIVKVKGVRIEFEYLIYNENDKEIANATTTLVFIDKTTKNPIPIPVNFLNVISKYEIK